MLNAAKHLAIFNGKLYFFWSLRDSSVAPLPQNDKVATWVNYMNRTPNGSQVRVEGLWIG